MVRHAAALAIALVLSPSWLGAQSLVMTVSASSADVYKSPSTGSPVIGRTPRGTVLIITRELGSWVKVSWPNDQSGVGYVHVTRGTVAPASTPVPNPAAGSTSTQPAPVPVSATTSAPAMRTSFGEQVVSRQVVAPLPVYVTPATHVLGLGGVMGGPTPGFGASARAWRRDRLGIQLESSRYTVNGAAALGRMTLLQFEPSLLYSLPDRVTDYFWLRPYLGSGASLRRQTLTLDTPGTGNPASDNSLGFHAFGGGEMTVAGVPRFALSADLNYRWSRAPFAGFEIDGLGVSVSGHWYLK